MVLLDTLKIRNLPKELTAAEKEEFIKHFGATTVKVITSNYKQKSVAFAKFPSPDVAKTVMHRLHQMTILGSRLCIEYAEQEIGLGPPKCDTNIADGSSNTEHLKAFVNRISSWNNSIPFQQPPPAHLKYKYPKANTATVNNIAHALLSVPKFYVQVLHLMNKMNLPPPFSNIPDAHLAKKRLKDESSESELESEPDAQNHEIIPLQNKVKKKQIKRPKFIKPTQIPLLPGVTQTLSKKDTNHATTVEEMFEKVDMYNKKHIEFSKNILEPANQLQVEEVETETALLKSPERVQNMSEKTVQFITDDELNFNKISPKELDILPQFKNYHPGIPNTKLYIKNLAKTVDVQDLEYIFNRYKEQNVNEEALFEIKLMQEGRMKGQAFITLGSVEAAKRALTETNGYILKTKPIVVVFAKSAVKK